MSQTRSEMGLTQGWWVGPRDEEDAVRQQGSAAKRVWRMGPGWVGAGSMV